MLTDKHTLDVEAVVRGNVTALLEEVREDDVPVVEATSTFPDLGIDSLLLARLLIELEEALDVDPFDDEEATVADLRTIGDLVRAFDRARAAA